LFISNTDVDSGIEYLPESVENFFYAYEERPEAKVKEIYKILYRYPGKGYSEKYLN